ncbi:hypothetical protein P7K49_034777 [Saguinus oedipus]|uniref:RAP domain-containing protein n=1 Tax=Saguinus oedipus TaxID=9490 RepID=A0ABQ9TWK7_SAGOE|nr:hypothetical protein P7K49_034777 [Saguinus oedipus]
MSLPGQGGTGVVGTPAFLPDGSVLLGWMALREWHLGLMGYQLLPLSFQELESQRGLPQLKSYLKQKLQALGLRWGPKAGVRG